MSRESTVGVETLDYVPWKDSVNKCVVKEAGILDRFYINSTVIFKARYRAHMNSFSSKKYCNTKTFAPYIDHLKRNKNVTPANGILFRGPLILELMFKGISCHFLGSLGVKR